jgi:AraC-like DNA-binding protein
MPEPQLGHEPAGHQYWTDLDSLPAPPYRVRTSKVVLDFVPAGPTPFKRVTIQLPVMEMMVAFGRGEALEAINSDRLKPSHLVDRSHFLPANTKVTLQAERLPEFVALLVEPAFAAAALAPQLDGRRIEERPVVRTASATLRGLFGSVRGQILSGRRLDALYLESLVVLALAEWIDEISADRAPARGPRLRSLARIDDFIRAHLDQDVTLQDLAAVAGLSPSHFLRAFKQATGQTPLRYLTGRRTEQACLLLAKSDQPIAEIAYACGFASQSHMTDVFKRHLDTTPGRYRQAHLST